MKKLILLFTLLINVTVCFAGPYSDYDTQPMIDHYNSAIIVNKTGSLTVKEMIDIQTTGEDIHHGIYRDIPNTYVTSSGSPKTVAIKVQSASMNGQEVAYHIKDIENGIRIYLGNSTTNLRPGNYHFTLTYITDDQIGFLKTHDELYWNAIGTQWEFPIQAGQVTVQLPAGARDKVQGMTAYTGSQGARGQNYTKRVLSNGNIQFTLTEPLAAHQGLTVVVGWAKGFVTPPSSSSNYSFYWNNHLEVKVLYVGTALIFLYFFLAWFFLGRDPRAPVVIPLFKAPEGFSPAACRYILDMHYDVNVFTAAVIQLAVKGFLNINQPEKRHYSLHQLDAPKDATLTSPEKILMQDLFSSGSEVKLNRPTRQLQQTRLDFKNSIEDTYQKGNFVSNIGWIIGGAVLSLAVLALCYFINNEFFAHLLILILPAVAIRLYLFTRAKVTRSRFLRVMFFLFLLCVLPIFCIAFLATVGSDYYVLLVSPALIVLGVLNLISTHMLARPSIAGQKLRSEIKGFKMFLAASEKNRLNFTNPPEKTPELFSQYLPYAFALGVEQKWAKQFSNVIGQDYQPGWYYGASIVAFNPTNFTSTLSSGLTASVGNATGSSGFGSGGGAGGGGGGGGGGGW